MDKIEYRPDLVNQRRHIVGYYAHTIIGYRVFISEENTMRIVKELQPGEEPEGWCVSSDDDSQPRLELDYTEEFGKLVDLFLMSDSEPFEMLKVRYGPKPVRGHTHLIGYGTSLSYGKREERIEWMSKKKIKGGLQTLLKPWLDSGFLKLDENEFGIWTAHTDSMDGDFDDGC